ncbi:MAG: signal peptidase I [Lachnospiraceae bacterium]|jgi:signal peptidase I, bacterial type|nr:signal peptidase I [Lachnospiraceae bacterium]MCI8826869.1 signal peptidase I [Lachnospiraceae bacterium]MCI9371316.1 signal peptidase I [Lachnospiraceae bacterium]
MSYFNPKPMRNILTDTILKWIVDVTVIVAAAVFLIIFLGDKIKVVGNSMSDKIKSGQEILIDKISYELRDIKRYDVIVYKSELSGQEEYVVKRVIGLPGEEIQIVDSKIYINGEEIEDRYCDGNFESGSASSTIKINDNEYFVMGDNRHLSQDSRFEYVGNIKRSDILGKAWLIISPFSKIRMIK